MEYRRQEWKERGVQREECKEDGTQKIGVEGRQNKEERWGRNMEYRREVRKEKMEYRREEWKDRGVVEGSWNTEERSGRKME
jgi:hypothetical protein